MVLRFRMLMVRLVKLVVLMAICLAVVITDQLIIKKLYK